MTDHILLVEDNAALAENIALMLENDGADVTSCGTAEAAVEQALHRGFDLAIVDIGLKGQASGLDVIPSLRRASLHGEILLMTGNATLQSALQAIRSGVYAYVPKPFEPEQFTTLVKRALAQVALKREKHALTQQLAASEALYRGVVETVEACILGLDAGGVVRFANRFTAERMQLPQEALVGTPLAALGTDSTDDRLLAAVSRAVAGQSVRDIECRHKIRGGERVIRWTLTPLSSSVGMSEHVRDADESNSPLVLAVGIDITERLALERKNAEAEAMAAMGTLTTSLAHEIRNPLNAAVLQLELVLRRTKRLEKPPANIIGPAEVVRGELGRLATLLDEFLNLARPRRIVLRTHSAAELLYAVADLKEPLANSAGVTIEVSLPDPALRLHVDPDKLKQVLVNLVANAIEALGDRRATGDGLVELSAELCPEGVSICVHDNGPGISEAIAETPFKPFVTDKASGTGLGLAIVQKIVHQHGGSVALLARVGGGTTARVVLPASPDLPT